MRVKKSLSCFIYILMLLLLVSYAALAGEQEGTPDAKAIKVTVNGHQVDFDVLPYINDQNRTMVPIRFIGEELGSQVSWLPSEAKVAIKRQGVSIELIIGADQAKINDRTIAMDTQAELVDGRTMVPLRFISEAFEAKVSWQETARTVVIAMPQPQKSTQGIAVINSNTVNIRSGPGSDAYDVLGQAFAGNEFKIVGLDEDTKGQTWCQVELNDGSLGWVAGWLVKLTDSFSQTLPPEDLAISDASQQTAMVMTGTLNIRSGPGTSYEILDKASIGDLLSVFEKDGSWLRVSAKNGLEGWIAGEYVTLQTARPPSRDMLASRGTGRAVSYNGSQANHDYPAIMCLEYEELEDAFFLILTGNSGLQYNTMLLQSPLRLVIDVKNVVLDLPLSEVSDIVLRHPFINKLRAGQFDENTGRIVLELASPVGFEVFKNESEDELTFLFQKTSIANKVIVIDPGHGTIRGAASSDPGATGPSGLFEKDVVLDIATKLSAILTEQGANVVLTRTGNTPLDLGDRANVANSINADLFVSVHANASTNRNMTGSSTYFYAPSKDPVLGPQRAQRIRLAQLVQQSLVEHGRRPNLGVLENSYKVIRETRMPSILVETAFISNPTEERLLADPAFRTKLAQGIAEGIIKYFN